MQSLWSAASTVSRLVPMASSINLSSTCHRRPGQPLRPREAPRRASDSYPLTPSPASANAAEVSHRSVTVSETARNGMPSATSPTSIASTEPARQGSQHTIDHEQSPEVLGNARRQRSPDPDPASNLVPYYAGQCSPSKSYLELTLSKGNPRA